MRREGGVLQLGSPRDVIRLPKFAVRREMSVAMIVVEGWEDVSPGCGRWTGDRDRQWLRRVCCSAFARSPTAACSNDYVGTQWAPSVVTALAICRLAAGLKNNDMGVKATAPMVRSIGNSEFSEAYGCRQPQQAAGRCSPRFVSPSKNI
jgi:hypothetical protein